MNIGGDNVFRECCDGLQMVVTENSEADRLTGNMGSFESLVNVSGGWASYP
jgi:hypothetical protein